MAAGIARTTVSMRDQACIAGELLVPLVARGLIVRRPRVEALLDRIDADRRAVARLRSLRDRYGPIPLPVRVFGRDLAIVLNASDAHRILEAPPSEYLVATREKAAALRRFQPHGVLASSPPERPQRRRFNEKILHTGEPIHPLADLISNTAADETAQMLTAASAQGALTWTTFSRYWWRLVRRITLGDHAQDDQQLLDQLTELRRDANWAASAPRHDTLRRAFQERLDTHLRRREPGSLASLIASTDAPAGTYPAEQVPQWLFAFDGAAMATYRALALIDAHLAEPPPRYQGAAAAVTTMGPVFLESLRLWPTTPAILRETTADTTFAGRVFPASATMLIYTPLLHRDPDNGPADRFAPELWRDGEPDPPWAFPFSAGHASCPGREFVTLTSSIVLAHLLDRRTPRQRHPRPLRSTQSLPGTLDPFRLRYALTAKQ